MDAVAHLFMHGCLLKLLQLGTQAGGVVSGCLKLGLQLALPSRVEAVMMMSDQSNSVLLLEKHLAAHVAEELVVLVGDSLYVCQL